MAKRKNPWTEDKIARYYKEGRGSGELAHYKPWLTVVREFYADDIYYEDSVKKVKISEEDKSLFSFLSILC
ncbi:hypothetical protein [Lentibacillus salicampi]|uniref:Uncharacterized protein n=1 Tax=Lentibacillus salicampi TaxID=175306 RepID=A0A4Y9AB01_9BACI|nr:hypothetical protein [Lentibacillus salicampi]TFJ92377.1 hypothetical protein E4U82_12555 [Lentibacillus salicampi]